MARADEAATQRVRVEVVHCAGPGEAWAWQGQLPAGATLAMALHDSGFLAAHPSAGPDSLEVGIWGRRCDVGEVLAEGDRIEVYRALRVDPKEARRLRYRGQAKAATARKG